MPRSTLSETSKCSSNNRQHFFSTTASSAEDYTDDYSGPWGDLFEASVGPELLGKKASIRRTFDAQSNALGLLTCGGQALAKHASFDPEYERARGWIQHHAVGPAVLSPVLIGGLVGALIEAAVPQSVPMASTMRLLRPLIVGVCRLCDFCVLSFSGATAHHAIPLLYSFRWKSVQRLKSFQWQIQSKHPSKTNQNVLVKNRIYTNEAKDLKCA